VLPLLSSVRRERALRAWFRALLAALRIRLKVSGGDRFAPPGTAALVVSNHVSWLDLVAISAVQPLRMVAKSEIGGWPLIGALARRNRTIFVHRERLSTLPAAVATVSDALGAGTSVGVFPEATTWCGMASGRFRPAFFQAAADTATPVRPVALRYRLEEGGTTTVAAFIGSATLWHAVVTLAGVRGLLIELRLLPVLPAEGADRRALAAAAGAAVTAAAAPLVPVPADPHAAVQERFARLLS
jgi:1-acyl-sn-glycerol-3-phosphate acyltransferase